MNEQTPVNTPFPPPRPTTGMLSLPPPPKMKRQLRIAECALFNKPGTCPLRLVSVLNQFTYCILRKLLNCEENYEYYLRFRNKDVIQCRKDGVLYFVFLQADDVDVPILGWTKRNKQFIEDQMELYQCTEFRATVVDSNFMIYGDVTNVLLTTPFAHRTGDTFEPAGTAIDMPVKFKAGTAYHDQRWDRLAFTGPTDVFKYHEMAEEVVV